MCSLILRRFSLLSPQTITRAMSATTAASEEVTFSVENRTGCITLNKPKVLNALNHNMVKMIDPKLREWVKNKEVDLIVMDAAGGKAFCAGGDIRAITEVRGADIQKSFFRDEYFLNHLIGSLPVPYVALIHGITMGGGVGLSVHGKYRVATEKTMFAMPETAIGLFPDVGGSYFLPRLQGQLGTFLALSGHRLKGLDNLHAGIATHMCPVDRLPQLKNDLLNMSSSSEVESVLASYSDSFPNAKFGLEDKLDLINRCFGGDSVEDVMARLNEEGGEWGQKQIDGLRKMSPMSVKITLRGMREGATLPSLAACLAMEYRLVQRCCEDFDFYEGVRAVLVDKDNSPAWAPSTLEEVTDSMVDRYFSRLPEEREIKIGGEAKL